MSEKEAKDGGKPVVHQPDYCPPQGPKGINNPQTPGLHGSNHGNAVNQGKH